MSLFLKNPHSILAVLKKRPCDVLELIAPPKEGVGVWHELIVLAKKNHVQIRFVEKKQGALKQNGLKRKAFFSLGSSGGRSGIAGAVIQGKASLSFEALFNVRGLEKPHGLWIALDGMQDPQNVGAIFRTAAFFKARGILMTQENSVPMTAVVYDVASGGVEYVPFSFGANLQRAFEYAKKEGLWILGSSEHAEDSICSIPKDRSWLLVIGNEEKGMRRLTTESCDLLCKIEGEGHISSLNASVSAGILIEKLTSAIKLTFT